MTPTYILVGISLLALGYLTGRTRPYQRLADWTNRQLRFGIDRWVSRPRQIVLRRPGLPGRRHRVRRLAALAGPLDETDVLAILKTIRRCRYLATESIHVFADDLKAMKKRLTDLHAPVQHMGRTWCSECSVRRRTGPRTDEWVALIPHPCPTIQVLETTEPTT